MAGGDHPGRDAGLVPDTHPAGRVPLEHVLHVGTDTIGFELAPAPDGGTVLVLTEELGAHIAARNAGGWEVCLDRLEHGAAGEPWEPRFDRYVAAFEPVLGRQEGPPEGHR